VFAQGLSTSKRTLEKAQAAAARKVGIAQAEVLRAERASHTAAHDSHLEHADERLAQAQRDLDAVSAGGGAPWADRLRALPWKRILMAAGALFVAAIVLITAIELAAGRSVSSITGGSGGGGTTIGHVGNRGSSDNDRQDRKSPGPDDTSSPSPSDQTTPSREPTPSDSVEPSQTPSQSPSVDTGEGASDGPSQTPDDLSSQPAAPSASP
jgi:hypothetical protein